MIVENEDKASSKKTDLIALFDRYGKAMETAAYKAVDHAMKAATQLSKLDLARLIKVARERRYNHFPADIFGEPVWDLLIDLYISHAEGVTISVTSACIASRVSSTTALRCLSMMSQAGLVGKRDDPFDRRRSHVYLTDDGVSRVEAFLDDYAQWVTTQFRAASQIRS